jgi:hypothetical protein
LTNEAELPEDYVDDGEDHWKARQE